MRDRVRPSLLAVFALAVAAAWIVVGFGAGEAVHAEDSGVRKAGSVCEAHELRALQKKDPSVQIDLGEFGTPWPTEAACLSHEAAGDPDAPGPLQPIQFSHKHHAG